MIPSGDLGSIQCRPQAYDFIRIHFSGRLKACQLCQMLLNIRDPAGAACHNYLINICKFNAGVLYCLLHDKFCSFIQLSYNSLKKFPGYLNIFLDLACPYRNVCLLLAAKLHLHFLCPAVQLLICIQIFFIFQVNIVLFFNISADIVHKILIKKSSANLRQSTGALHNHLIAF